MSNRHVMELSSVWRNLVKDAVHAHPTLELELEKDLTRLTQTVKARGIRVFLEDLPAIGKHFDRCLSAGKYSPPGLPLTKRRSGGVLTPKFLGGLHLLVFTACGHLKEDADMEAVILFRQLTLFAKKAIFPCPGSAIETAVVEMVEHDASLPEVDSFWEDSGVTVPQSGYRGFRHSQLIKQRTQGLENPSLFLINLDMVSKLVTTHLGPYRLEDWRFRHGPGAVSERSGKFDKYKWSNWSDWLEKEFPFADCGFHNFSSWVSANCDDWDDSNIVPPVTSSRRASRLVAVPKSFAGPRLIAAEPSEHMWCQQHLWHYWATRVRSCWIRKFIKFDDQSYNQELCTKGSTSGALATIDLSMASDCVTPHVVGQIFRFNPKLLLALRATRTHVLEQQLTRKVSSRIMLRKYSTMGNATTFPVESTVFLVICLAACLTARGEKVSLRSINSLKGELSIFGDDIIIPKDCRELVVQALEALYFKVNINKSFWEGNFRESCGVDSFRGVNVTPIYWRTYAGKKPESIVSVVDTRNRFYNRFYLETASYLESTVPAHLMQRVHPDSGAFGIHSRLKDSNNHLKWRCNLPLFREEVHTLVPTGTNDKTRTEGDSALLQYFTEAPSPFIKWEAGFVSRTSQKLTRQWVPAIYDPAQGA